MAGKITNKNRIRLSDIYLDRRTINCVNDTLKSGWLTPGPKVNGFEEGLAKLTTVPHVAAVSSATLGLWLSLKSLDIEDGSEVITTPFTFIATIESILHAGLTPVLADIEKETLTLDPDDVVRKISKRTRAILTVDIAGQMSDYLSLRRICKKLELHLISDAAHSLGASFKGKSPAELADVAVHSFHATKNLTCGEGGAVVSKSKRLIDKVRLAALHGMSRNAYERRNSSGNAYDIKRLGFKGNMSDLHAAIGLGQLESFKANQQKRKRLARRYIRNLSRLSELLVIPKENPNSSHAWHLFIVQLQLSQLRISRDRFIDLMEKKMIECGVHFKPVYDFSIFRDSSWTGSDFPVCDDIAKSVVSLPMHPLLKQREVDYVCETIDDILNRNRR